MRLPDLTYTKASAYSWASGKSGAESVGCREKRLEGARLIIAAVPGAGSVGSVATNAQEQQESRIL